MKTKMAIVGAIITLLMFQSSFAWRLSSNYSTWRGGWIKIYNPVAPVLIPIYVSYHARSDFQLNQRRNIRGTRNLIRGRDYDGNRSDGFSRRRGRVRTPRR